MKYQYLTISEKKTRFFLKAVFRGGDLTKKVKPFGHVKAVTYNEMKIDISERVMIQVVVDM